MTISVFQSCLAELVAGGTASTYHDRVLTYLEKRRLETIASQAGVDVMRTLYFGWRLTKVLSLLPFTAALLGDEALARHLRQFWQENKATSLYFIDECLKFLAFLEKNLNDTLPYLEEVVAFERAKLRLRDDLSQGRIPRRQLVRFRCEPTALLRALSSKSDISEIPLCDVILQGELTENGNERWTVV